MIPLHESGGIDRYKLMRPTREDGWIHHGCFDVDQNLAEIRFHSLTVDNESREELRSIRRQLVEGSPWKVMTGSQGHTECSDQTRMGRIVFKRDFIWLYRPEKPWMILGHYRPA